MERFRFGEVQSYVPWVVDHLRRCSSWDILRSLELISVDIIWSFRCQETWDPTARVPSGWIPPSMSSWRPWASRWAVTKMPRPASVIWPQPWSGCPTEPRFSNGMAEWEWGEVKLKYVEILYYTLCSLVYLETWDIKMLRFGEEIQMRDSVYWPGLCNMSTWFWVQCELCLRGMATFISFHFAIHLENNYIGPSNILHHFARSWLRYCRFCRSQRSSAKWNWCNLAFTYSLKIPQTIINHLKHVFFNAACWGYLMLTPDYVVLMTRTFVTLEGIAASYDPDFNIYTTALPITLRRLVSPSTAEARKNLRNNVLTEKGEVKWSELKELLKTTEQQPEARA